MSLSIGQDAYMDKYKHGEKIPCGYRNPQIMLHNDGYGWWGLRFIFCQSGTSRTVYWTLSDDWDWGKWFSIKIELR